MNEKLSLPAEQAAREQWIEWISTLPAEEDDALDVLIARYVLARERAARREERERIIQLLGDALDADESGEKCTGLSAALDILSRDPAGDAKKPPPLTMGLSENLIVPRRGLTETEQRRIVNADLWKKPAGDAGQEGKK